MRNNIFSSRTKYKIVLLLFQNPKKKLHMRKIERLVNERINSVREALLSLVDQSLLIKEKIGRKLLFQANPDCLFYDELLRITAKQSGLGGRIIKEKLKLGKIKLAFLTADYYQFSERAKDNIDLFIVGNVSLAEVAKLTKEEGDEVGIEINYSVMNPEELRFRKKNKDPFLQTILQKNRLILIGKEDYLKDK